MQLIQAMADVPGWIWLAAVALNFLACFAESAGSFRNKAEEDHRKGFAAFAVWTAALLAPGLLLLQAFVVSSQYAPELLLPSMGAVLASFLGATLIGWIVGAIFRRAAGFFHYIAGALSFAAAIAALIAAWPNIGIIVGFLQALIGV